MKTAPEMYHPSTEVIARAHVKDWDALAGYRRPAPRAVLGGARGGAGLVSEVAHRAGRFQQAVLQVVRRRQDQHRPQRHRPAPAHPPQEQAGLHLAGRGRQRAHHVVFLAQPRGEQVRQRAQGAGRARRATGSPSTWGACLELPIAMLACAKIGAVHSVVYGGFSVEALHGRIEDSQSRVLITCDGAFLNGKMVELKSHRRRGAEAHGRRRDGRGLPAHRQAGQHGGGPRLLVARVDGAAHGRHRKCETEQMDAEDMLFMLYTSGTTGKPKAIVHTHGGYSVGVVHHLQVRVRHRRRGPLLVRRRPGLDHRPQLHRVRAADARRDQHHVRGRADLSRIPIAGGASSRSTASRSCTPRRPPSAA